MVSVDSNTLTRIRVKLDAKPFQMRIPKRSKSDVVQICVWTDASVFRAAQKGKKMKEILFFESGTGIAGASFSLPEIFISNDSHNYFAGNRLETLSDTLHGISISKFVKYVKKGLDRYHITKQEEPLYMVVLMDLNGNEIIDNTEVEYFILEF